MTWISKFWSCFIKILLPLGKNVQSMSSRPSNYKGPDSSKHCPLAPPAAKTGQKAPTPEDSDAARNLYRSLIPKPLDLPAKADHILMVHTKPTEQKSYKSLTIPKALHLPIPHTWFPLHFILINLSNEKLSFPNTSVRQSRPWLTSFYVMHKTARLLVLVLICIGKRKVWINCSKSSSLIFLLEITRVHSWWFP